MSKYDKHFEEIQSQLNDQLLKKKAFHQHKTDLVGEPAGRRESIPNIDDFKSRQDSILLNLDYQKALQDLTDFNDESA